MSFYSAAHYRRVSPKADTAADIAWRIKSRKASELALADRQAKYPTITVDNFDEAGAYQESRIAYYMQQQEAGR